MDAPSDEARVGFARNLRKLIDSVFYGSIMRHVGEDVDSVIGDSPAIYKSSGCAAVYMNGNVRLACPVKFVAGDSVLSLCEKDEEILLHIGEEIAHLLLLSLVRVDF